MEIFSLMPDVKRYNYRGLGSLALSEGDIRMQLDPLFLKMDEDDKEFCDQFIKEFGREVLLNIFLYVLEYVRFNLYKPVTPRRARRILPLLLATAYKFWKREQAIKDGKTWEEYEGQPRPRHTDPNTPLSERGFGT